MPKQFRFLVAACILAVSAVMTAGIQAPPADVNLSAFANGALIESVTSEYGGSWQARWLTDENPATGWSSAKSAPGPFAIVISLAGRSELHGLEFDTASVENEQRGAKDIEVAMSDTSATAGFTPVTTVALKPSADGQRFPLPKPAAGSS